MSVIRVHIYRNVTMSEGEFHLSCCRTLNHQSVQAVQDLSSARGGLSVRCIDSQGDDCWRKGRPASLIMELHCRKKRSRVVPLDSTARINCSDGQLNLSETVCSAYISNQQQGPRDSSIVPS